MLKKPNNNFADPETRSQVRYRLFIIHNKKGIDAKYPKEFGYNGYITHADKGYANLLKILKRRKGMILIALMFDFSISSKKPIHTWDYSAKKSQPSKKHNSKKTEVK